MGTRPQHSRGYRKLCKELRRQRLDAELTQRALAKKLNRPHSFVYKTEKAERRIDPIEFAAWCRACGADPCAALAACEA